MLFLCVSSWVPCNTEAETLEYKLGMMSTSVSECKREGKHICPLENKKFQPSEPVNKAPQRSALADMQFVGSH